ncbi:SCP2 domain-containing protein [Neisseria sp. ZJ106]|uniref:SCP2 domain-containing protein n=1 Tax=Neisseria lisongii TaxID=2912188 RepID=A0ABY7RK65_9NEIS|nr:SCP2 domain-containing protein [Neisseria lisongii]MCF7521092.1 SCP2 domain-containing protein [Neisseria lisongii]WCL72017.1 SCP2 domain-containing protein [Neisseria lisongii]
MSALLPIINHLIQQNPQHQRNLAEFTGKTVSFSIAGFRIQGRIGEDGFLEAAQGMADTEIIFHNSTIQKLLQNQQPGVGDIRIDGDLFLGMALLPIFSGLRYDAHADLNRLFGENAGALIAEKADAVRQTVKQIGQSIAEQIGEFSREPESPVPDAATLEAWIEEVDRLRDDVARLNARLDRLERDIWL